jgi:hypothetical protein
VRASDVSLLIPPRMVGRAVVTAAADWPVVAAREVKRAAVAFACAIVVRSRPTSS